jgi:hypothetical protein
LYCLIFMSKSSYFKQNVAIMSLPCFVAAVES